MRLKTRGKAPPAAFTMTEIMIVVALVGMLCAIAIPNFIKYRTRAQAKACINNLRQIDSAIQQWALEGNKAITASVKSTDVEPYMFKGFQGRFPFCPAGGTYHLATVQDIPTCNITNHVLTMTNF